jgi:hypothetical protein
MTDDMFDTPATGVKITDFDGALLLLKPTAVQELENSQYSSKDVTVTDITVLDGPHAGEHHPGSYVYQKVLQGQLRPSIGTGRMVLGRLGLGVAKPGQSAPWILADPTDADKQKARDHLVKAPAAANKPPF